MPSSSQIEPGSGAELGKGARFEAGSRLAFDGHGSSPRKIRIQARAQSGSVTVNVSPARLAAAATASSTVAAPPSLASGFRNGTRAGAPDHQAAQKKRRRFVDVIDTTGAKRSLPELAFSVTTSS